MPRLLKLSEYRFVAPAIAVAPACTPITPGMHDAEARRFFGPPPTSAECADADRARTETGIQPPTLITDDTIARAAAYFESIAAWYARYATWGPGDANAAANAERARGKCYTASRTMLVRIDLPVSGLEASHAG